MREVGKTWSLGGISIAVEEDSLEYPALRISKHAILDTNETLLMYIASGWILRDVQAVIFSGYTTGIVPLIGSGYHTLISDQGTEDDYFITNCRPQRLQALNKPNPVYRINVTLKRPV